MKDRLHSIGVSLHSSVCSSGRHTAPYFSSRSSAAVIHSNPSVLNASAVTNQTLDFRCSRTCDYIHTYNARSGAAISSAALRLHPGGWQVSLKSLLINTNRYPIPSAEN